MSLYSLGQYQHQDKLPFSTIFICAPHLPPHNTGTKATYHLDTSVRCMNFRSELRAKTRAADEVPKLNLPTPTTTITNTFTLKGICPQNESSLQYVYGKRYFSIIALVLEFLVFVFHVILSGHLGLCLVAQLGRVTAYALENAHRQLAAASAYLCWRNTSTSYVVLRRQYAATKSFVSRFLLSREVRVCSSARLHCTCKFYERNGIPCRHMYAILGRVRCTDFDVRWWMKYGQKYGEPGH